MKKSSAQRRRVWIDEQLQGVVLQRVILYWFMCFVFLTVPILIGKTMADPSRFFFQHFPKVVVEYWPMYVGLMALLPVIAYDTLMVSHRVAGPMFRVRKELELLAKGESTPGVQLRQQDFFQDVVEPINEIREMLYCDAPDSEPASRNEPKPSA